MRRGRHQYSIGAAAREQELATDGLDGERLEATRARMRGDAVCDALCYFPVSRYVGILASAQPNGERGGGARDERRAAAARAGPGRAGGDDGGSGGGSDQQ